MDQLLATVLRALLTKAGWAEYGSMITEDVLHNGLARSIYAHIKDLHGKTDSDLTLDSIRLDISSTYRQGETRTQELLETINEIEKTPEVDSGTIREAAYKFVSRELMVESARIIATNISQMDFDANIPFDLMQRALEISQGVNETVLDIASEGLPGEVDDRTALSSLGLSTTLDSYLGGGIANGELVILLAPPARGKTSYLCAIGARAAAAGQGVLHITLEIPGTRVVRRYDSVWTGLTAVEMIQCPGAVDAARKVMKRAGGSVLVKDWSYKHTSPIDVKNLVRRLRAKGKRIDLVIIDYLELMTPSGKAGRKEQRHLYGQLGKDIRSAAVDLDTKMVSAWQVNRAGAALDTFDLEHTSECWDIVKHADIVLGLNQNPKEELDNLMRITIRKQRSSTSRPQVLVYSNLNTNQIRDIRDQAAQAAKDVEI